jgi:hypothetical protein
LYLLDRAIVKSEPGTAENGTLIKVSLLHEPHNRICWKKHLSIQENNMIVEDKISFSHKV